MFKLIITLIFLTSTMAFSQNFNPKMITVLPENIYIPPGFDSNDNAEIVIEGYLPNTCYKVGPTFVDIDPQDSSIQIDNQIIYHPSTMCLPVRVPYMKTIIMGMLNKGKYELNFFDDERTLHKGGLLPISKATKETPDDHLYAPVTNGTFHQDSNGNAFVVLAGEYTKDCMKIDEVKVISNRSKNVIEVLPKMKYVGNRPQDCVNITNFFNHRVPLKVDRKGRQLIHIRTLNGKSTNIIGEIK